MHVVAPVARGSATAGGDQAEQQPTNATMQRWASAMQATHLAQLQQQAGPPPAGAKQQQAQEESDDLGHVEVIGTAADRFTY